jgi:hypothetical protein
MKAWFVKARNGGNTTDMVNEDEDRLMGQMLIPSNPDGRGVQAAGLDGSVEVRYFGPFEELGRDILGRMGYDIVAERDI